MMSILDAIFSKLRTLNLTRREIYSLTLISIFILLFFKPLPAGDGFGYYAILEGVVKDHTLNFESQVRFNEKSWPLQMIHYNNVTGKYVTNRAFGFPLLSTPLYLFSLFLDDFQIFHIKDKFFIRERGDILIHMVSMSITTLIFVCLAIILSILIIKRYYSKEVATFSVLLIFFSSPLLKYATYDTSYTHGVEAGLMAIIVLLFLRDSNPLLIGAIIGLLATVRYTSVLFLIPLTVYYLYYSRYKDAGKLNLGALLLILTIPIYWNVQFGSPFTSGYSATQRLSVTDFSSYLWGTPFDLHRGILFWTPNLIIATAGLLLIDDSKKWVFLGFIASYWIAHSALGTYGAASFGNRRVVVFFPLFCIGMAEALKKWPKIKYLVVPLAVYTLLLFLLYLTYPEDSQSFVSMMSYWFSQGNLNEFPGEFIKKVAVVRFLYEF